MQCQRGGTLPADSTPFFIPEFSGERVEFELLKGSVATWHAAAIPSQSELMVK